MRFQLLCWLALGVGVFLHGCSGGGSGAPAPLEVLETVPIDSDAAVQPEVILAVEFDEDIDPATVTSQTITLSEVNGASVAGAVALGSRPDIVLFTPEQPLQIITDYRATVATDLMDVRGHSLEEEFSWSFRTIDDEWGLPESISRNAAGDAESPKVGVDSNSTAVAVWLESDGTRDNVVASRFTRPTLWDEPEPIESFDQPASELDFSMSLDGQAFAVWREQQTQGRDRIWAARYTPDGGWSTPESIEAGPMLAGDIATNPTVAVDPNGNAVAIWYQTDVAAGGFSVWSNRYRADSGAWGAAENIEPNNAPAFRLPSIAVGMDAEGNATAIWTRGGLDQEEVWANHFDVGEGWNMAERIEANETGDASSLAIAVATNGDAHALWSQPDEAGVLSIWGNVYSSGAWGAAALFDEEETFEASSARVTAGPGGTLQAVWAQSDGTRTNVWSRRYTTQGAWGASELIERPTDDPQDDGDARFPQISIDQEGNAFAVWQQFDGAGFNIWSNRYTPDDGWFEDEMLEMDRGTAILPQIAAAPGRRAHAVWQQRQDDAVVIRTNRFE